MSLDLRKVGLLLLVLLVAVFFIQWFTHYLTFGNVIVTTDNRDNQITIIAINETGSLAKGSPKQAKGSFSANLRSGGYTLSVQGNLGGVTRYVKIKAHTTNRFRITLPAPAGVEPVTYDNAQDVAVDSSTLVYLNTADATINKIGPQNQFSKTDISAYNLKSVQWADISYGVGQNSQGQLFVIKNGVVSPLRSPVPAPGDSSVIFAVAPNREIYIGLGASVYAGTDTKGFKKIYDHLEPGSLLHPGLNKVSVENGYGMSPVFTTIYTSGKQASLKLDSPLDGASAWSGHDKYMAIFGSSISEVLDTNLHRVATLSTQNINNPVWLGDNTLLYGAGDQLWSYGLQTQSSQLIANMPQGDLIQQLAASADKSYVYITLLDGSGNVSIRRVGLKGQRVPGFLFQLQDILPLSTPGSGYRLGLINFSGVPAIRVTNAPGGPANAQQLAAQELQADGFDLSKLQFEVVQGH